MTLKRHRELFAVSIAAIGAGIGVELLEAGGWLGPFIACIGVAVALFLAWDMPGVSPPKFHGHTTIQPREDDRWLSTLPAP